MKPTITKFVLGAALSIIGVFGFATSSYALTPQERYDAADKAVQYLVRQQQADGSIPTFDDEGELAAIALKAAGVDIATVQKDGVSLLDYFKSTKNLDTDNYSYTYNLIQRAIALKALGYDTNSFEGVSYDDLIALEYANNTIQTNGTTYDDAFGLVFLLSSDNPELSPFIQPALDALANNVTSDGGFCYSVPCDVYDPDNNPTGADTDSTLFGFVALAMAYNHGYDLTDPTKDIATISEDAGMYIDASFQDGLYAYSETTTAIVASVLNTIDGGDTTSILENLKSLQDAPSGSFGFTYDGTFYPSVYTSAYAVIALLGTNWLLDPAPIERPVAAPVTPISTPPAATTIATTGSTFTPLPASQTSSNEVVVSESPAPIAPTTTDTDDVTGSTDELKSDITPTETTKDNTNRNIGITLITLASLGIVAYGLVALRQRGE